MLISWDADFGGEEDGSIDSLGTSDSGRLVRRRRIGVEGKEGLGSGRIRTEIISQRTRKSFW